MSGWLGMLIALLFYEPTFSLVEIQRNKNISFFVRKSTLNFVLSYFFAALDDVPFVVSEKFCQNPKEVNIV